MPRLRLPLPVLSLCVGLTLVLMVAYIGLIATVMAYGALTVDAAQSVRDDTAQVAALESNYLAALARVTAADYAALGYAQPSAEVFVPEARATALR